MDRLRTLLLARTTTVVLDPDRVASAATRPSRDTDIEKLEDELAQLGFVMSLDLAMTVRRLPHQASQELKTWMVATLAATLGGDRPEVPLYRGLPAAPPSSPHATYLLRVLSWLSTRPEQPCPWCGQVKPVGALDPCGHLVCEACWSAGSFAGCPVCHRRVAVPEPFVTPAREAVSERVTRGEQLRIVHLAFDPLAVARERFERLLSRRSPLSGQDREEIEAVIDVLGPKAVLWIPARIPIAETLAVVIARFWIAAPDRAAMVRATHGHLASAIDVLRIAAVLMGANPALAEPMRLASVPRGLRRAILQALDRLPIAEVLESMRRHAGLWKRIGERLHPFEWTEALPNAALAFAALRGSDLAKFPALEARAKGIPGVTIETRGTRTELRVTPWASAVEDALRARDAAAAIRRLGDRPDELLRRADHALRIASDAALAEVLAGIRIAIARGTPGALLTLVSHVRARAAPWPRRVMFPGTSPPSVWGRSDARPPLRPEAIDGIVESVRRELVTRAEQRKQFARAVIDRGLDRLPILFARARAARARGGRDVAAFLASRARPTMWDLAAIHVAARANVIYVRETDGTVSTIRRRDGESSLDRLLRIYDNPDHDSQLSRIPHADAPTLVALLRDDLPIPRGSAGYLHDARGSLANLTRLRPSDLIAELGLR